jgi:hypothetical protein
VSDNDSNATTGVEGLRSFDSVDATTFEFVNLGVSETGRTLVRVLVGSGPVRLVACLVECGESLRRRRWLSMFVDLRKSASHVFLLVGC